MSMTRSGRASRSFISGSRLWPPARTFASKPWVASSSRACSTDVARSYSNAAGIIGGCRSWLGRPRGRRLAPHDRGAFPDGLHDRLVAGAAAEVAVDRPADVVVRGVGLASEQVERRHEHPRRAEAALEAVVL